MNINELVSMAKKAGATEHKTECGVDDARINHFFEMTIKEIADFAVAIAQQERDVHLQSPEQNALTPGEMRAEIILMEYHDPLVRSVFDMARYKDMSPEDLYTVLAFHAIREKNAAHLRGAELLTITSTPLFTIPISAIKQEGL